MTKEEADSLIERVCRKFLGIHPDNHDDRETLAEILRSELGQPKKEKAAKLEWVPGACGGVGTYWDSKCGTLRIIATELGNFDLFRRVGGAMLCSVPTLVEATNYAQTHHDSRDTR